jgi:hypothetical protein
MTSVPTRRSFGRSPARAARIQYGSNSEPLGTPDRAWSSHSRRRRHCRRGDGARHAGATSFHGPLHRANELCDRAGGQHDPRHAVPRGFPRSRHHAGRAHDRIAEVPVEVALHGGSSVLLTSQSKRGVCAFTTGSGSARWRFHSRSCRETRSSVRGVVPSPQ